LKEKFLKSHVAFGDFITGNRFIDAAANTSATFCKTDFITRYTNSRVDVFITHNSDFPINDTSLATGPSHKYWLAQNKECTSESVIPIPIGLENMKLRTSRASSEGEYSSQVPGAFQKAKTIEKLSSFNLDKTGLIYMNFSIDTFPKERKKVWNTFAAHDWVTKTAGLTLDHFYFDLASHKFTVSPRGNGLDCHRTWEALYLKTIPIVKRCPGMAYFEDLPIYFIDDWSEITEDSLNSFYENMLNNEYDLGKMRMSWWQNKIKNLMRK
jgi:hypothetical protein